MTTLLDQGRLVLLTTSLLGLLAAGCSGGDPGVPNYVGQGSSGLPDAASQDDGAATPMPDSGGLAPDAGSMADAAPPPSDASDASDAPSGPAVLSFTLIDTSVTNVVQGQPVAGYDPMVNGSSISLATVGTNLSVRANLNVLTIGSVGFVYDGASHTEGAAPYVLCGDNGAGVINNCNIAAGPHTMTATPYSAPGLGGTPGTPLTINFTITP